VIHYPYFLRHYLMIREKCFNYLLPLLILSAFAVVSESAVQQPSLEEATIEGIHAAYDAGTLTAVELVQYYLDRIAAYDASGPGINSIITLNPDAVEQAAALDNERRSEGILGRLHGIPVLLKDNIDTFDMPTTNGSAIMKDSIPPEDATLTKELRRSGAIILGKASMGEFASGSYNTVSGQTLNPYHIKRQTGGSSSGSAAAIAADFAVLAVGTDGNNSVRVPASHTSIVGLRPTTGLISRNGLVPKQMLLDTAGPMARTVRDVAHMLSVMAVVDPADPMSIPVWEEVGRRYEVIDGHVDYSKYLDSTSLAGQRVGVVMDFFGGDPEIERMAEEALGQIEALGAILVEIRLEPDFIVRYLGDTAVKMRRIADYNVRADFEEYLATVSGVPATLEEFIELYETVVNKSPLPFEDRKMELLTSWRTGSTDDPAYHQLIDETLPRATADKLALFEDHQVDVLVFPYVTSFAGVVRNPVYELEDPSYKNYGVLGPGRLAGYSSVGFPNVVVPMGFGLQGLPASLAFLGKPYSEGQLLGYAYAYEQASRKRKPSPLLPPL